jgi:sialate O-acetylesterase
VTESLEAEREALRGQQEQVKGEKESPDQRRRDLVRRRDWRGRYGADLPMLNGQLANYGPERSQPSESGWAELREAQRRYAERDPHYGIAVAVDIGDRYDIHPANKQEVGRRLARLARHLVYGESDLAPTGPQPLSARRAGSDIVLAFADVSDGLLVYGADDPIGFELCGPLGDEAGDRGARRRDRTAEPAVPAWTTPRLCRYADATLDGDELRLRLPDTAFADAATHVRHAWADNPIITLFDSAGLPVQPFEIPINAGSSQP